MEGQAAPKPPHSHEEEVGLLEEEKFVSDTDSDAGNFDLENRLRFPKWVPQFVPQTMTKVVSKTAAVYNYLSAVHWGAFLLQCAIFLLPSFLQGPEAREKIRPTKIGPTAYLDGMRGLAALFVCFCHYSYQVFKIARSWGAEGQYYNFVRLPFIRIFYQGPAAVCVFFVISGYALSYKPLKLAKAQGYADFTTTTGSMVFRRWFRLFLPPIISTLMTLSACRLGLFELTRDFATNKQFHPNVMEAHLERWDDGYAQFKDWAWEIFKFIHVWDWEPHASRLKYDVHLWTIPMEYRCSLYLFLMLMATVRLRPRYRIITMFIVACFTYRNSRWDFLLFLGGMFVAEMDHLRNAHSKPPALPVEEKQLSKNWSRFLTVFWNLWIILAFYFLCQPDTKGPQTPGWRYLSSLIPKWWDEERFRYFQGLGSIMFVFGVARSPGWQWFFNTGFVQYFGKLSYAIYLMHGPVIHLVGYHWEKLAYSITGTEGHQITYGFFLGALGVVPSIVWAADIFWRLIDIPTVNFARWFEGKMIKKA